MSFLQLVFLGLRFHWRAHFGAFVGSVLCTTVLAGSFLVADSLRGTLRDQATARVGHVQSALSAGEKLFRSTLASEVARDAAPALLLRGCVSKADGTARLNQVQVLGVDGRFWELALAADRRELQSGDAVVNKALAERLGVQLGESLVLRVEKPSPFSRDAPLSGEEDAIESIRIRVVAFADDAHFGRFSMHANQVPSASVFLPLETLQQRLDVPKKANLLLSSSLDAESLQKRVTQKWTLEDAGLQLRSLPEAAGQELRSSNVFLEPVLLNKFPPGNKSLTYFVNAVRSGSHSTPYSMVSAVTPGSLPFFPDDISENETVISEWLAADLDVKVGASVELSYFVMGERRTLEERSRSFRIKDIIPNGRPGWDSSWMPDFPGLADVGNCRDWKPGFALSLDRIRDNDEAYWKQFRGTPKAFISLKAGQEMWANRWGSLTAVRYPNGDLAPHTLLSAISPTEAGFQFIPMRQLALAATSTPVDFAGLFGGFSFFLIIAALALVGLLFGLMVEKRGTEAGTLLAVGWSTEQVRSLFLSEGVAGVVLGALLGSGGGLLYTQAILFGLRRVWSGATSGVEISFHATFSSLLIAVCGSVLAAIFAMVWVCHRSWRRPARVLLAGETLESGTGPSGASGFGRSSKWIVCVSGFGGLFLSGWAIWKGESGPEWFFGGGALCLIGSLVTARWLLSRLAGGKISAVRHMAWRNIGRRSARAMVTMGVLASGAFLVLSVEVFRKTTSPSELHRNSGTGGFALIGQLSAPVYEDLNLPAVRDAFGLPKGPDVKALMVREKEGDEASCLNLNRAVKPRILGVPSTDLERLGAFRFTTKSAKWSVLQAPDNQWIPAVADEATIRWALQKSLGDEILVHEGSGGVVRLKLVAALSGSILQGALLIDDSAFQRAFPNLGGYRTLLLDVPAGETDETRAAWSRALSDRGLELISTSSRLADLNAVANTYLSIFQVLGGLGVLLGALGGAVVAARNVIDRRMELAILLATGWRIQQIRRLLKWEHFVLIALGTVIGGGCVWLVTGPVQYIRGEAMNGRPLLFALGCLFSLSVGAVWIALNMAMPRRVIDTLRAD